MGRMQITIPARYRGPASSGNGGWTAGSLAQAMRSTSGHLGPITVRLSAPPPLDRVLDVALAAQSEGGEVAETATLLADEAPIATASAAATLARDPVPFVDPDRAAATASEYPTELHPFPHCFVCGPARRPGDGMRLTPGPLPGGGSACLWRPADTVEGAVPEPLVWSALDCPGGWASDFVGRPMVLGTMTVEVLRSPPADATHVVTGRLDDQRGRLSHTSSAVWTAGGVLLARAEAIWVAVDAARFDRILAR
jgi:hypothetical protein